MKSYQLAGCALGLFMMVTQADASTLYGSTSAGGPGELWILNPATGAAVQDVGPLNDAGSQNYAVTGLAFDPISGVLYGSTGGRTGTKLLTIDPASGLVTVVGSYNAPGAGTMADLAFDPSGQLYGVSASGGANLYSINIATGQATEVGPSGVGFTEGGGLAVSPGGVFYGTPTHTQFGTYDPITGTYSNITNPIKPGGSATSYAALAFDGSTLYGMDLALTNHLVTIDPATGAVTDIGPSVSLIDGIAFQPEPAPEPGTMALLVGAGAMAFVGNMRRGR